MSVDQALLYRNLKTEMALRVHDELLFDAPEAEAEVGRGPNWRDAK